MSDVHVGRRHGLLYWSTATEFLTAWYTKFLLCTTTVTKTLNELACSMFCTTTNNYYSIDLQWFKASWQSSLDCSTVCPINLIITTTTIIIIIVISRRLSSVSNDPNETFYLFHRISVVLQRFNSVLLRDSFPDNTPDQQPFSASFILLVLALWFFTPWGIK